jgi:hypothetical protein
MLQESLSAQNEYDIENSLNNNSNSNNQEKLLLQNNKINTNLNSIAKLFFLYILSTPVALTDVYIANNNNQCVTQNISKMTINMYDYLIISGGYTFIMIIILAGILLCIDYDKIKNDKFVELVINYYNKLNLIFLLSFNISAAVMFWLYMNTDICNNQTYNYLFVSLIIKLVCCLLYCINVCVI